MKTNTKLQDEVEFLQLASGIGDSVLESDLRAVLATKKPITEDNNIQTRSINKSNYYRPILGIIVLIVISTIAYLINKNFHAKNIQLQYADLVDSPLYPEERGGKLDNIESAISLYRSGNKSKAKKILKNANSSKSNYWLSEFYLQEEKIDSALMHLPKSTEVLNKRDRINFLNIVCLYLLGQTEKMTKAINELPSDTEQFYLAKYKRLELEK